MEKTYEKTEDGLGLKVTESKPVEQNYSMDYVEARRKEIAEAQTKIDEELSFLDSLEQKMIELEVEEPVKEAEIDIINEKLDLIK